MSELEKQLLKAFARLSEQYEKDMKHIEEQMLRLQGQNEALEERTLRLQGQNEVFIKQSQVERAQVERLEGQINKLINSYKKMSEVLSKQ